MQVISLTDHDTVEGVEETAAAGEKLGVRMIPGIEMSVQENDSHLLGYGIDYRNPQLLAELEVSKKSRLEGARQTLLNLRENEGLIAEWEEVVREAGAAAVITSPNIVYAVMKRQENKEKLERDRVYTKTDFYRKYLAKGGPNLVKRYHLPAATAIALIHSAGGAAVWSHPILDFYENYEGAEEFLRRLLEWGLDGIEVFARSHNEDVVEFLEGLVRKYKILRTAGSDFHAAEPLKQPDERGLRSAATVGDYETFGFSTEDIVPKLDEAVARLRAQVG